MGKRDVTPTGNLVVFILVNDRGQDDISIRGSPTSDEIVACLDWVPTLGSLVGEGHRVPIDLPIDGIDNQPFDVLARGFAGAMGGDGEGKVTPLELLSVGVLDLDPRIRELIREAA